MNRMLTTAALLLTSVAISQAEDLPPTVSGFLRMERIAAPRPTPAWADDLPPAAAALMKTFEGESEQIKARIEAEIAAKREVLIQQLQAMQDGFTREAKLDEAVVIRDAIRKLRRSGMTVLPDPGALYSYRGQIEKVLHFDVVGSNDGSVYGTDLYTDDSDLSTAAVHAGILKSGEKGIVKVTILPGQASYSSSTRNGITSTAWHQYPGSYKVEAIPGGSRAVAAVSTALPDPGWLSSYRGQIEKVLHFDVVGSNDGTVYGTDLYTDDSDLSTAAVHAGVLNPGEKGIVKVTILPGQAAYVSTTRNGVTSTAWSQYPGSFKVESIPGGSRAVTAVSTTLPDPGSLYSYENQVGKSFEFLVTGSTSNGVIWGTGVYTGDSKLSVASVHAGVLRDGETGVVKVTIMAGDSRYLGSARNGVSSHDYNSYPFSYRVDPVTTAPHRAYPASPRLFLHSGEESRSLVPATGLPPGSAGVPSFQVIDGESIEFEIVKPVPGSTPLNFPPSEALPR